MALPIKTYWPTLAQLIYKACQFITRHQQVLTAVVDTVDPAEAASVADAFAALIAACALFISVMKFVDPNWKPK